MLEGAHAGASLRIPASPSESMPFYFAGTNSRISGHAHVTPGTKGFLEAILKVNGEEAYHGYREVPDDNIWLANWNVHVMFDSTHFSASSATVEFRVKDNNGTWHSITNTAPIKNRALIAEHPAALFSPDTAPYDTSLMSGLNYQTTTHDTGGWTASQYFSSMAGANVVWLNTHANQALHECGDGSVAYHGADGHYPSYEERRKAHLGLSPKPPYNPTGNPAINFAFFDACNMGDTNNFIRACWPYENYYAQRWLENQAILAFNVYLHASYSLNVHNLFGVRLADGLTIGATTAEIEPILNTAAFSGPTIALVADTLNTGPNGATIWRDMIGDDITLYGDADMRIKSVYTGTSIMPIGWKRVL